MTEKKTSIIHRLAEKYSVDPDKLLSTLKATCFRQKEGVVISNEQMMTLLIVADQYQLNPFIKEIYAYPEKNGGVVPVVGVDGWARIINSHPAFNGVQFGYSDERITHKKHECYEWIICTIHRKDRHYPTVIREYFSEVVRTANFQLPWDSHPNRMHRHKTLIQCARVAFGFAGIYDQDEAERILESEALAGEDTEPKKITGKPKVEKPQSKAELEKIKSGNPSFSIVAGEPLSVREPVQYQPADLPPASREPGADDGDDDDFLKGINSGQQ